MKEKDMTKGSRQRDSQSDRSLFTIHPAEGTATARPERTRPERANIITSSQSGQLSPVL